MKYGFEREWYVKRGKEFVLAPRSVPKDGCGYLAEARGEPHSDPYKAAFLLMAEEMRVKNLASNKGITLVAIAYALFPPKLLRSAIRSGGKKNYGYAPEQGNLYGKDYPLNDKLTRAGLHIHFSHTKSQYMSGAGHVVDAYAPINMPAIIRYLDNAFKKEIAGGKRIPGEYEMKPYGFEYRSLPATTDPLKVAAVLAKMEKDLAPKALSLAGEPDDEE